MQTTQQQLDYQRIQQAIEYIADNFKSQPELKEVAAQVHLSPHHFQRLFTEWAGVSPKKFLQFLTVDYLKNRIQDSKNLTQLADMVGLSSQSRVYDLFVNIEGVTPATFKNKGVGLTIFYGYHNTPFGECFLAATDRGICGITFLQGANKAEEFIHFAKKWDFATLVEQPIFTESYAHQIFYPAKRMDKKLTALVQGTPFQIKVWEALLNIPQGELTTYQHIAESIDKPKAVRAVGTAIGKNPIGYLIPCHRVIRKEGKLGQYRWGIGRKKAIIGWEMAQLVSDEL
ncbi:MAG: bifunctional helix-turn-helix domain-containing protein/methylated-DNA--[protein]-cysteine S-methyltransferase [Bacteroidota bacterium]